MYQLAGWLCEWSCGHRLPLKTQPMSWVGCGSPLRWPRTCPACKAYKMLCHRNGHRKQDPDASVSFTEFSPECLVQKRPTTSPKERGKLEDMTKVSKPCHGSLMSLEWKEVQESQCTKQPPSTLFLFVLPIAQTSRESILEMLQKSWDDK